MGIGFGLYDYTPAAGYFERCSKKLLCDRHWITG